MEGIMWDVLEVKSLIQGTQEERLSMEVETSWCGAVFQVKVGPIKRIMDKSL